jgi:cobalt-zinc-cadmium efflux system outer membrane protein
LAGAVEPIPDSSASAKRPDIVEAEARVRLADARIAQARSEGRVDVSVFGSYMRMDAGFSQQGVNARGDLERVRGVFHYVSGGATVMIPLWNRNQGAVAAAQAERTAAEARLEALRIAGQADIAEGGALVASTQQVLAQMSRAVTLAQHNLDVVRQTYELGRATLADVLVEQRRRLDVEKEYTTALREAFEARTSLDFARGELQ